MLYHLAHHFYSTFSGLLRSRQAVSGLLLMAAGTVALLWLRVDASVAAVGLLALVAWKWGRSKPADKERTTDASLAGLSCGHPVASENVECFRRWKNRAVSGLGLLGSRFGVAHNYHY